VELAVSLATLVVSLVLLWAGVRHLEFGSLPATVLTLLDLLAVGLLVFSLGWWGVAVFAAVNVTAVLIWSVILAAKVEAKLVSAAIQAQVEPEEMTELAKRLRQLPELKAVGPVERGELVRLLAERNRTPGEIEEMAVPLAMLKSIHGTAFPWLVENFDRLLRLGGEPATKAGEVADILHNTTTNSPMTFEEALNALVTVYGEEEPPAEQAAA
jgi:hypothetical protein